MKKITLLLLSILLLNGCGSDDNSSDTPNESTEIIVESTNVKSFELVNLRIENSELLDSYQGTFGDIDITINKVDENNLAFLVPDISQGDYNLNFDLGNKGFNVSETIVSNPQETINDVFIGFNTGISNLDSTNPYIENEIQNAMSYFSEVQNLYNSLTDEQKVQVALYYEANKDTFQRFVQNTNLNIDASTVLSRVPQSQCSTTDFKSFYSCTAENLGESSIELTQSAVEFLTMLGLAGTAIAVSPATVGISLATAGIAVATAAYILIAETIPAAIQFKSSLRDFTRANWILTQATFLTIVDVFSSDIETNLNSEPTFRSLNENDENISSETGFFISSINTLNQYWDSLSALFPSMPSYQNTTEIIEFNETTDQINITNISNSNVELVSVTGQNAKFKSLSGEDETFSFDIEIIKEGFTLVETISNATVFEEQQIEGWYQANYFLSGGAGGTCDVQSGKEVKFYVHFLEETGTFFGSIYYREIDQVYGVPESSFAIEPFETFGNNQLASSSENFVGDPNSCAWSNVIISLYINTDGTALEMSYGINMCQSEQPNECAVQSYGQTPTLMNYLGTEPPSDL